MADKPLSDSMATPASAFKKLEPGSDRYRRDIMKSRAEGVAEGRSKARSEVVNFLHEKYMNDKTDRTSDYAKAILALTKELTEFLGVHKP